MKRVADSTILETARNDADTTPTVRELIKLLEETQDSLSKAKSDVRDLRLWAHDLMQLTPPVDGLSCPCGCGR